MTKTTLREAITESDRFASQMENAAESAPETGSEPTRRKKKLLYLAVCDPDLPVTGATVRMGAFVAQLARYYEVTLVNMAGSGHRVDDAIEERFRDRENRLGVSRRVRVKFSRPGYFLFSPTLYRKTDALLSARSFDYLLVDYGLAALYGPWFSRRYGIPLIYSSHNVEYRMYLDLCRFDGRRALLAPYVYWAERAACRAAQLVVAISENDRRDYARWISSDRIEVLPQGFDPAVWNPFYDPPPASPPVVLFVGNFRGETNRQAARYMVNEILPRVVRARPDAIFQLVGADPPEDLQRTNVDCRGFVDDIAPYMRRANLVLAPMTVAHGMATKIVAAMAFGKTVLATPEGMGAISRNYPQISIAPLDAFPHRIVELLRDRPPVDAAGFTDLCEEFAWQNLIARLYRRIEECCLSPDSSARVRSGVR